MENNKFKNKIITISGEPVTGKGTNVKALKAKLLEKGYQEENIHIITAGHEFRDYFNSIINFIAHLDDSEKSKELAETEKIKTIMEDEKYRGIFIEAISKLKANNKCFNSAITIEQANNIPELSEIRKIVDEIIDEKIKHMGEEINKEHRPDEVWIVDSRLAFRNIPDSFSVRLTCRPDIAGKRLFEDKSRGKEDSGYKNVQEAIQQREERKNGEIRRYKKRYDVDLTDENNYDVIIDTSFSSIEDISDVILMCLDRYIKGEKITKNWCSPKLLLPRQSEKSTLKSTSSGKTIDDMIHIMRKEGYNSEYPIEIIEVDGKKYIMEGHHRNFAYGHIGKTLIPYISLGKDDVLYDDKHGSNPPSKLIKGSESILKRYALSHEWILEKRGERFSYEDVYPGIYAEKDRSE